MPVSAEARAPSVSRGSGLRGRGRGSDRRDRRGQGAGQLSRARDIIEVVTRNRTTALAPIEPADAGGPHHSVFVAAGLIDQTLVKNLLEREVTSAAARILGYRRVETAESGWAVLQRSEGDSVEGYVLLGLDAEDLNRLDAYRGVRENLYRRVTAAARIEGRLEHTTVGVYLPTERTLRRLGLG